MPTSEAHILTNRGNSLKSCGPKASPTSEARILANRANSLKSCGPRTPGGKERSRRNGLKHGMAGRGIVVPDVDAAEVDRRHQALTAEMAPKSEMGAILIGQMATLSVRMERGARQEFANVAERVRHAADVHDAEQVERAEQLMATLGDDPRGILRRLRRFPEGVEALLLAWRELRADLTREGAPHWDGKKMVKMANLLGVREADARGSKHEALSQGAWGFFANLTPDDGAGLSKEDRQTWARARLLERVDAEIAGLEAHDETLDHDAFDRDRAEAGDRVLFDDSKAATLARRYESEARRGFFKSLKEFRQVEAEAVVEEEVAPAIPAPPADRTPTPLGSSREGRVDRPSATVELAPPPLWPPSSAFSTGDGAARTADGLVLAVGKPGRGPTMGSTPARSAGQ